MLFLRPGKYAIYVTINDVVEKQLLTIKAPKEKPQRNLHRKCLDTSLASYYEIPNININF